MPPWVAVTIISFGPRSAGVKALASRNSIPLVVNSPLFVLNAPTNVEPSDIITDAVDTNVPVAALSGRDREDGLSVKDTGVGGTDTALTVNTNVALAEPPFLVAVTTILCTPSSALVRLRFNRRDIPLVVTNAKGSLEVAMMPEEGPFVILTTMLHSMVLTAALSNSAAELGVSVTDAGVGGGAITFYPLLRNDTAPST